MIKNSTDDIVVYCERLYEVLMGVDDFARNGPPSHRLKVQIKSLLDSLQDHLDARGYDYEMLAINE